jgi:ABC-type nitrate/sulfonate/bicarbonate transport system substrate-binding protein
MEQRTTKIFLGMLIMFLFTACQPAEEAGLVSPNELEDVILMLDWVPNTNHTGIFVASEMGFFTDAGLNVSIVEPGEVYAEQAVSAGAADFGISFQEQLTIARSDDVPLVSIAAIIQHNTSGFASRGVLEVDTPRDWEGLRYGAFGSPFEEPTLYVLMECAGGDFNQLDVVDTGFTDPLALLSEARTDLAWIYYAWEGIQAELQGLDLNLVMMSDWFDCIPDYYTPIVITNEAMLLDQPETVRAFLQALAHGYEYAIEDPESAARILLNAVPELDTELVMTSQSWISPRYQADAPRWGEQQLEVWQAYTQWMVDNEILEEPIRVEDAMTNAFLP